MAQSLVESRRGPSMKPPRNGLRILHRAERAMDRLTSILAAGLADARILCLSVAASKAQQTTQNLQDDKLAGEPAPWTVPGKWGKRGNWGRWGEDDKRGMLNYITPEMVAQAALLVKKGKVYA